MVEEDPPKVKDMGHTIIWYRGRSTSKVIHNYTGNRKIHSKVKGHTIIPEDPPKVKGHNNTVIEDPPKVKGHTIIPFDVVELFYPILQPDIKCITPIYHPNIDTLEPDDNDLISNVCVSMLDDWKPVNGLDDCIQALLYLFYQPNTKDSLRLADGDISENQFLENVQSSLKGGTVEGCYFHPNYGWVENSKLTDDLTQYECKPEPPKKKLCKRF
ncbi:UBC12 [Mytilus edulis]|uniref:UBE2M n=1 Tax=Mytilus edulis TaxID=6550 RepID=A0A8S3R396_MYTED|nr:UBC12 [Mytilus edulis]